MGSINGSLRLMAMIAAVSLMALIGAVWYFDGEAMLAARNEIKSELENLAQLERLALEGQKTRLFEKEFVIYVADGDKAAKYAGDVARSLADIKAMLAAVSASSEDPVAAATLKSWSQAVSLYESEFEKVRARQKSGELKDPAAANALIKDGKDRFAVFLDQTSHQTKMARERVEAAIAHVESANSRIVSVGIWLALIAVCAIVWLAARTSRAIVGEVSQLAGALDDFSKGKVDAIPAWLRLQELNPILAATDRLKRALTFALERV